MSRIPLFIDRRGAIFAERLWQKDLQQHLRYIRDFRVVCPLAQAGPGEDLVPVDVSLEQIVPLRRDRGWGSVAANLFPNYLAVLKAVRRAEIVHSSAAGWAFPLSYYLLAIRPFRRFRWVEVVESSFWMSDQKNTSLRTRVLEPVHRFLVRACLRMADARIFTQDWYKDALFGRDDASLVAPASWIDEAAISRDAVERRPGSTRLIFPTRLTEQKGVRDVLAAIEVYGDDNGAPPLSVDIVGDGAMLEEVRKFCSKRHGPVAVRLLDPVPYGPAFFVLLRSYDAVLVAAVSQEQPRIVFDAFSQGVPCIASDTNGNRSVIVDGETGRLFAAGDPYALAQALRDAAGDVGPLAKMREAALGVAESHTHERMHATRAHFLVETLGLRRGDGLVE